MKRNGNKDEKERALPGAGIALTTAVPKLLTAAQVAKQLEVGERTVRDWLASGKLRAVRLPGRLVRVKAVDLARFIEDCEDPC
jgi:excisionase family DNA binding protein